ncbi:TetR/AcrR family transcriptional regulator [Clostridium transplantifaecale]|uniref:TetR/AcrR family transcriptional regulator n=1 Tax=Clostridium transplantifaecale TaxID=2479838 RepID=UPI000F643E28|nr:TetR/AcrR family transcriptional regulator [Clostridium transplantifaecale]
MRYSDDPGDRGVRRARNSPRSPRVSKDPGERKQEIIETALELLAEKGYHDLNVQDITDRMNVSPGLCYRYFKSKTDIFAAASEFYAMKMVEQVKLPLSQEISVTEKLKLVINRIFDFTKKHKEFESRYSEGEDIRAIYLDHVAEQWALILLPVIDQGVKEAVFHCVDAAAATRFLIFGLVHTFHRNIPAQNTEAYMTSYLDFTHEMFSRVLGVPADSFR